MKKLVMVLGFLMMTNYSWADEYYLGQWTWNTCLNAKNEPICNPHWESPHIEISTGSIDLRSLDAQAIAGGLPQGYAIFTYSTTVNDINMTYLGNGKDDVTVSKNIADIESKLGITPLKSTTPKEIIYELLTDKADPIGQTFAKPLMPDKNMKLDVNIGTEGVIKETNFVPLVSPESVKVIKVLQDEYKMKLAHNESHDHIGRWLDSLEKEYNIPYQNFIPDDAEIKLASLPHRTTITDNFNRADSGTLGSSSEGWSWTNVADTQQIVSNTATLNAAGAYHEGFARAESDLSSSDHYAQCAVANTIFPDTGFGENWGASVRFSSSANTHYLVSYSCANTTTTQITIYKDVAGTQTQLGQTTGLTAMATNDIVKAEANGSTIKGYVNGVSQVSVTDTAITTGTRTGMQNSTDSHNNTGYPTYTDNFQASDLAAAAVNALYKSTLYKSTLYRN